MIAQSCRLAATVVLLGLAVPGLAQTTDNPSSTPLGKGTAPDGTRPSDGAIKGGSILPGERSGVPGNAKCAELSGSLREDCLKQEREAGVGGTTTESSSRETPPSPPVTTPPQNPNPVIR